MRALVEEEAIKDKVEAVKVRTDRIEATKSKAEQGYAEEEAIRADSARDDALRVVTAVIQDRNLFSTSKQIFTTRLDQFQRLQHLHICGGVQYNLREHEPGDSGYLAFIYQLEPEDAVGYTDTGWNQVTETIDLLDEGYLAYNHYDGDQGLVECTQVIQMYTVVTVLVGDLVIVDHAQFVLHHTAVQQDGAHPPKQYVLTDGCYCSANHCSWNHQPGCLIYFNILACDWEPPLPCFKRKPVVDHLISLLVVMVVVNCLKT